MTGSQCWCWQASWPASFLPRIRRPAFIPQTLEPQSRKKSAHIQVCVCWANARSTMRGSSRLERTRMVEGTVKQRATARWRQARKTSPMQARAALFVWCWNKAALEAGSAAAPALVTHLAVWAPCAALGRLHIYPTVFVASCTNHHQSAPLTEHYSVCFECALVRRRPLWTPST